MLYGIDRDNNFAIRLSLFLFPHTRVILVVCLVFIIAVILSSIVFLLKGLQSGEIPLFFSSILININE